MTQLQLVNKKKQPKKYFIVTNIQFIYKCFYLHNLILESTDRWQLAESSRIISGKVFAIPYLDSQIVEISINEELNCMGTAALYITCYI